MENVMNILIGIASLSLLLSLAAMIGLPVWVRVFSGKDATPGQLALTFALATIGVLSIPEIGLLEVLRDGTMRAEHAASQPVIALVLVSISFLAGAFAADYTLKKRRSAATAHPPTDAPRPPRRGRTKRASA